MLLGQKRDSVQLSRNMSGFGITTQYKDSSAISPFFEDINSGTFIIIII